MHAYTHVHTHVHTHVYTHVTELGGVFRRVSILCVVCQALEHAGAEARVFAGGTGQDHW